ncbi:MAG: hypothetical protein WBP81_35980, partial [Solirubrobacteraceae bacterium]
MSNRAGNSGRYFSVYGTVALAHRRGWQRRRRFGRTRGIAQFHARRSLPMSRLARPPEARV